ncbi:hypothetical protein BTUL_0010g00390 [Botrytis tulipae]|uniref:Uncharacterized protein n=1 Tax=Botrytis tulipae TaxID=87230 RepID=A0A4Z1F488_9HELO|nr:hypothetical protein BTUL_0010g00390 [Botrytis tulipae]
MLLSPTLNQKKYGVPPTPIAIIVGSHRSGLTPISAYDLTNLSANASREERTAYQQSRLRGYTSQLLVDLDVVSLRSLTIPEDSNPINPTMQRSRWVESSDLVLPISSSEKEGISWTAQNPLIWEHLQPYQHVLGCAKEFTSDGDSLKEEIKEAVSHGALYEPMWRREQKSELGWAGEASMFGGTHSKIPYNKITNGPGLGSTLDPWSEYDAARHGDTPQLVLPLGSTWESPLPIHMHTQFRSEDFWSLYARKYGLFHPVNSIGYAHAITIEDDYAKDIDYQYKVVLPSTFNGYLSPVSVITPTLHGFSKPSKRTYAEYLLLNQGGRMDKAKTLQSRLERFRDLFHEINATMHQQSKTLMDYAWLFAYFEEPPEPEYEEAECDKGFEKWLDKWTEYLNKLTEALDACLQNFEICIHRLMAWETAIKSSLYSDRYHEEEINQRINLKNFGANLLELIKSLKFIEGENDSNLQGHYNNSVDTYWTSRRKLSPECDYATVTADNASSAQKNKAVFEAKLQRARAPLAYMDVTSFEPLCNQLLHDDLGAALKPALRAELFILLTNCTSLHKSKLIEYARGARKALLWLTRDPTAPGEEKQSALDKRDEL